MADIHFDKLLNAELIARAVGDESAFRVGLASFEALVLRVHESRRRSDNP